MTHPDSANESATSDDNASAAPAAPALQSYFQSATFTMSAAQLNQCPKDDAIEVAFAGRSNAGKSSAINRISTQKKLARTSKTPGRTQLINFFDLKDGQRLVDLPGYGYAKVSKEKKNAWQKHLEQYLEKRKALKGLVLVMDVRHPLQSFDAIMLDWVKQYDMHCHVLLTKADKIKRGPGMQAVYAVEKAIRNQANASVQLFSAQDGTGLDEVRERLWEWLH